MKRLKEARRKRATSEGFHEQDSKAMPQRNVRLRRSLRFQNGAEIQETNFTVLTHRGINMMRSTYLGWVGKRFKMISDGGRT